MKVLKRPIFEADIVVTTYLRQIIGPIFLHPISNFGGIRIFDQGQRWMS